MTASVKLLLAFKRRKLSSKQLKLPNFSQGEQGEHAAQIFLTSQGYRLLATNLGLGLGKSLSAGEIDIVAHDPNTQELVFIEVKSRQILRNEEVNLAVNWRKKSRMNRVAQAFLNSRDLENDYRFDIIWVLPTQIKHFKNVTW